MRLLATPERKLGTQRIEDCFSPHFWHIEYISPHFYIAPVIVLYLAATCVSAFFSSHRFVNLFGGLALVSFIAAYVIYAHALVSVWCFFAALLSILMYVHMRFRSLGGFPPESSDVGRGSGEGRGATLAGPVQPA